MSTTCIHVHEKLFYFHLSCNVCFYIKDNNIVNKKNYLVVNVTSIKIHVYKDVIARAILFVFHDCSTTQKRIEK